MFAGTLSTGGVVSPLDSVIVTVNDLVAVLPCASVAVHVIVVVPIGKVEPELSPTVGADVHDGVIEPSTRSVAVGAAYVSTLPAGLLVVSVMFAGTVIVGGVVSVTVTVNEALAVLWCASVAEHVTVVVPSGNVDPEVWSQVTPTGPSTRSFAVGFVKVATAPDALVASTVMFAGTPESIGGVVSTTVTWNEAVAVFPAGSLAVQVTVVVPSGNLDPDGGVHTSVICDGGLSGSVAVTV
jgi:hypothetical protein